jgi:hypothetical protein
VTTDDAHAAPGGRLAPPSGIAAEVNLPDVVDEVAATFAAYERALVANDVAELTRAFWTSELTVRYGVAECLYGAVAIAAWRGAAPAVPAGRTLHRTTIATFGRDVACVSTEFRHPGGEHVGRQSQTWLRLAEGWRIVAAHVSHMAEAP